VPEPGSNSSPSETGGVWDTPLRMGAAVLPTKTVFVKLSVGRAVVVSTIGLCRRFCVPAAERVLNIHHNFQLLLSISGC